jgi:putative peptidoglycan lipid II flippase
MNQILKRANKRISLGSAATLLIGTALLGQVLGFLRTMMVNASFKDIGPNSTDAYFAAFKIPDFFFLTLAAGALGVAFMPILAERIARSDRRGVWELSNSLMNLMAIVMTVVGFTILLGAQPLMHLVAPNMSPQQLHNAVTIMRLVSFNPLLFTLSGVLTAVQQSFGRFFFFAIGPIIYNMCIIASIFLFRGNLGLIGLGIGALVGAIMQLGIVTIGLLGLEFHYRPKINFKNTDFKRILRQLPARSIDQGVDSINSIVETNRARKLGDGFVTYYENAFTLHTAPILLVGTAISTAAFPRLVERLAQNRSDLFRKDFTGILQVLIWVGLPVSIISYFCRGYLARIIFKTGSRDIALIFGFLSVAIFFRILYTLLSRYFYANKDTVTPLLVSLFAIGLNIALAFTLARPSAYGASGLAMAQSIVAASEVAILTTIMMIRDHRLFDKVFFVNVGRSISVSGFTIVAAFVMVTLLPLGAGDRGFITLGFKTGAIATVTLLVHLSVSSLFGLEQAKAVTSRVASVILKPIKIQ